MAKLDNQWQVRHRQAGGGMGGGEQHVRRLSAVPPAAGPSPAPTPETAAALLPGTPRVAALDALLREVDALRLGLESGLSATADAVAAGALTSAAQQVDADRVALGRFEQRALGHLSELSAEPARSHSRRRRLLPAAPFVAAAALVGFLSGAVPSQLGGEASTPQTVNAATNSWVRLTELASSGGTVRQLRAAALELHAELAPLIARAASDPAAAQEALALLHDEQVVLSSNGDSSLLLDVLRQSQALTTRIVAALPRQLTGSLPAAPALVVVPTEGPRRPATSRPAAGQPGPTSTSTMATHAPATAPASPAPAPAPAVSPTTTPAPPAPAPAPTLPTDLGGW